MRDGARLRQYGIAALAVIAIATMWSEADAAAAGRRPASVSVQAGRMSAAIDGQPLAEALVALSRAMPVTVTVQGASPQEPVFASFRDAPLEEGIRRLLRGQSYLLVYATPAGPDAEARLEEIVVLVGDEASDHAGGADATVSAAAPPAGSGPATSDRAEARRRERALRRAERRDSGDPSPGALASKREGELASSLMHSDDRMRAAALWQLRDSGEPAPVRLLARLARVDDVPALRMQALEILARQPGPEAREPLRLALWDPDPAVRDLAARLLDQRRIPSSRSERPEAP